MKKEIIFGIYIIRNKITGKVYIGSSSNIDVRWRRGHRKALRGNRHENNKLQNAWNKYGEENFTFEILDQMYFPKDYDKLLIKELLECREQFHLDTILFASEKNDRFNKLGYNICRIAGNCYGFKHSEDSILKLIKTFRKNAIIICQCDKNGVIINEFVSVRDAARKTNIQRGSINCVLNNKSEFAGGFRWKIKGKDFNEFFGKRTIIVAQYTLKNKLIGIYKSVVDAAKKTNSHGSAISDCIVGIAKQHKGFIWKRITRKQYVEFKKIIENDNEIIHIDIANSGEKFKEIVPIYQYTLRGIFVKEWENMSVAALSFKLRPVNISKACNGKLKTAHGYVWRLKTDIEDKNLKLDINEKKTYSKGRKIMQFSLENIFIKEWDSMIKVEKSLKINSSQIGRVCSGEYTDRTAGGYIWKYKENKDDKIEEFFSKKDKFIAQYDLKNNLINVFKTQKEAGNSINKHESTIGLYLNGKIKNPRAGNNFIWKHITQSQYISFKKQLELEAQSKLNSQPCPTA